MTSRWRGRAAAAAVVVLAAATAAPGGSPNPTPIGGPFAALLAESADLGPSRTGPIRLTAALAATERPGSLIAWAQRNSLSVRWRPGDSWALVEGGPAAVQAAFGIAVRDYRRPAGQTFYASTHQPAVPAALRSEVTGLGRIMSFTPHHTARPAPVPREVPGRGLTAATLLRTYNVAPLRDAGHTGRGVTVVVFSFDGVDQSDLDQFAALNNLPAFTPEVVGGLPSERDGEATQDLQAIHALAPAARTVLVNALPTVAGDAPYARIAAMLEDTARRYPGAVWSFSIGWGCDRLVTAADLEPVRAAVRAAQRQGTTVFDASGDLAGLECRDGSKWADPPSTGDAGLDAVASVPEVTSVGGTTLSTDADGGWVSEEAWYDGPLSQGSGGGASGLFDRPAWQQQAAPGAARRLTPDVAAVADPFTGLTVVDGGQQAVAGGTSLSAPLWAGFTAVINDYLATRGAGPVGEINPLLYRIAADQPAPVFRDVTLGGNAVDDAGPGYDPVTGLGTPDVDALARALLAQREAGR